MQHLQTLLSTYNVQTQHNSTAKNNYYKFNANAAYVKHCIALRELQNAYKQYTQISNCANAFATRYAINAAIVAAQNKIKYAQAHNNFCAATANSMLQKAKRTARKAAITN
jgi:molybdopterin/thiamine biosynthesis adenylyltransferase